VDERQPRKLSWIASSRKDMRALPKEVRRTFGVAQFAVQIGETPPIAKALRGFGGAGVLELIEDDRGRHLSGGLRRALCDGGLCAACVSEEIQARQGNAATRYPLIRERLKRAEMLHRLKMMEGQP
jgi:hypothetical protein